LLRVLSPWIAVACLVLPSSVNGDDWPDFRGPTGQGLVPAGSFPLRWSPTENVVWKQALPGTGWSSPIVCGARVFLTTAVALVDSSNHDQSLRVLCLDAGTGRLLWEREVFQQDGRTAPRIHAKNSHASPSPVTDGKRLYVHFGHQGTACLDLNGSILWQKRDLQYRPVHGNGGSPVLAAGSLVFSADGSDRQFLVALDCATGAVRWQTQRKTEAVKKFSFNTPLVITVKGRQQVISTGSEVVGAYDLGTGEEIWRVRHEGYSVVPRAVYGHGLVFVCTGYEAPQLLAIRPDGRGDVTASHVAWMERKAVPLSPSPLLAGNELYLVSDKGIASCLDARTGQVHWRERLGGTYSASPVFTEAGVYFQSEEGKAVVLRPGLLFERLAENDLRERALASYAAADGAFFVRTERHLYRIEAPGLPTRDTRLRPNKTAT
jgi:outer membrane protein assembly factor BamB